MKKSQNKLKSEKFEFNEDRYIRLIFIIVFEAIAMFISMAAFISIPDKISPSKNFLGYLTFVFIVTFLQIPFISFFQEDFIPKRLDKLRRILKWFIRLLIAGILILGVYIAYVLLGWKIATGGLIIGLIPIIILNWNKIEKLLKKITK